MDQNQTVVDSIIKNYIDALKQSIQVDKVILYGSWANGNPHEFSDIDLAIFSVNFGKSRLKEIQFLSKIAWDIDPTIEAVPYSTDKLNVTDPSSFVYEIIHKGITVYDNTSVH